MSKKRASRLAEVKVFFSLTNCLGFANGVTDTEEMSRSLDYLLLLFPVS